MNKLVSVGLQIVTSVIDFLAGSAILALALHPCMSDVAIADVAILIVELRDAVLAAGTLRAVETAAAHHRGQAGDGDAVELVMHDVVDTRLQVGNRVGQALNQPLGNLTEEDAALGARIQELRFGTAEEFLRQHIKHLVGQLWWGEHLIVAKVSKT